MKVIKKYKLVEYCTTEIDGIVYARLEDYDRFTSFDTEEEAIEYAYSKHKWNTWTILPVITFDNHL
jgi:hypothetical protein